MTKRIAGLICARGGSKGIPRKNVRLLGGRPLIAWAIKAALASEHITEVVVSTDDEEIAETARKWGAEIPFIRPAELARDDSPEWLVWRHALDFLDGRDPDRPVDVLVNVPPTSPLRTHREVDACVEAFLKGDADIVITVTEAARNPYFNMITMDGQGRARLVIEPERALSAGRTRPRSST